MPEENKKSKIQFIVCDFCAGAGKSGSGSACKNCSGAGVIAFYAGRFFYWNLLISVPAIKLRHLKNGLNLVVNSLAYILGLAGLMALAYWVWRASEHTQTLEAFSFWRVKSPLILTFWISLLADMFVIYRLSQAEAARRKITKPKYDQTAKYNSPNNWSEFNKVKGKYKVEVSSGFSLSALKAIEQAFNLADYAKHGRVRPIHLFFSLLKDRGVAAIFSRLNIDSAKLIAKLKNQLLALEAGNEQTVIAAEVKEIFFESYISALNSGQKRVEPAHFILPILARDKNLSELLYDLDIDHDKINNVIQWFIIGERLMDNYRLYRKASRFKPATSMDRAYTAVATPILNHFAYDLTLAAKWGRLELCVGREDEVKEIFQILESGKNGVLLSGPAGVGKKMIIGQIAKAMVEEDVPKMLRDKRLLELDITRLLSGASAAKAEERLLVIIDEVARAGNIILYINDIENLMGITAGGEESFELSEVLVSAVGRHNLICLASASQDNYAKYIENKPLGNIMAKVEVEEPDNNLAIQMLESKIGFYEAKYKVYFTYSSIAKAVELSAKYIYDKYLPAKAVDILEAIAVKVSKTKGLNSLVDVEDVAEIISQKTKIPLTKITEKESEVLLNLEEKIHNRMIGQAEAVNMVAASLRRARTELREQKRPIANFLFLGPTGVGKTELAKTVAEVYFGDEDYMVRLDMSEYQRPESIEKMIGSPDGILGYLTEAVRKAPFSLILLDELEKAHPEILNLFLQVMDDGRLTDGSGRTIDFTNSIIIATSNIGAVYIQDQIKAGAALEQIKQSLINDQLNKYLKPELINRFDGVIVFKPLEILEVESIAKLMLNKVRKMLEAKGIGLECDEAGIKKIAALGFDPKFGARPLRRLIQEKIENEIANKVLADGLKRRDTVVIDGEVKISVKKGREL
ncbi:MAG: ATP-dependent Clp protease ATP-binding subunit [Patescibacteria group bacterium]|jgi:ATP-dependent Clp protease ATP-binding subunit ClpC